MPEAHNAIRVHFDQDEPPALVFHPSAQPGALVSWAWCQLTALDTLLAAGPETRWTVREQNVASAVRSVLTPVINALVFAELRAHELRVGGESSSSPPEHGHARRKMKRPAALKRR